LAYPGYCVSTAIRRRYAKRIIIEISFITCLPCIAVNIRNIFVTGCTSALRPAKPSLSNCPFFYTTCAIRPTYRIASTITIVTFTITSCSVLATLFACMIKRMAAFFGVAVADYAVAGTVTGLAIFRFTLAFAGAGGEITVLALAWVAAISVAAGLSLVAAVMLVSGRPIVATVRTCDAAAGLATVSGSVAVLAPARVAA
jgi:hypothetical protein